MSTNFFRTSRKNKIEKEKENFTSDDFIDIFSKLSIKSIDPKNNPDLLQRIRENRIKVTDHVKNNFKVWDGKKLKPPNMKGRYPRLIKNLIKGMRKSFFGSNGRISKFIEKDELNPYLNLKLGSNSFNSQNICNNTEKKKENLIITESQQVIENTKINFQDQKQNQNSYLNDSNEKNFIIIGNQNSQIYHSQKFNRNPNSNLNLIVNLDNRFKLRRFTTGLEGINYNQPSNILDKIKKHFNDEKTNFKLNFLLSNKNFSEINNKNENNYSINNAKESEKSNLYDNYENPKTRIKQKTNSISFNMKTPELNSNLKNFLNSIQNHAATELPRYKLKRYTKSENQSQTFSQDISNSKILNKTNNFYCCHLNDFKSNLENIKLNSINFQRQIRKDKKKYNSIENIFLNTEQNDFKLFSNLMNRNQKFKQKRNLQNIPNFSDLSKNSVTSFEYPNFSKNMKKYERQTFDETFENQKYLTPLKVKGNIYNIDQTKADLIKYADSIKEMNETAAYKQANKIAKEYEKKEIEACVDENSVYKKFNNNNENKIDLKILNKTQSKFEEIRKSLHVLNINKTRLIENLKKKKIKIKLSKG